MPTIQTAHLSATAKLLLTADPASEGSGEQGFAAQFAALLGAAGAAAGAGTPARTASAPEQIASQASPGRAPTGKPGGKVLPDRPVLAVAVAGPDAAAPQSDGDAQVKGETAATADLPAPAPDPNPPAAGSLLMPNLLAFPLALLPPRPAGDAPSDVDAQWGLPELAFNRQSLAAGQSIRPEAAPREAAPVVAASRKFLAALALPSPVAQAAMPISLQMPGPIPFAGENALPLLSLRPAVPAQGAAVVIAEALLASAGLTTAGLTRAGKAKAALPGTAAANPPALPPGPVAVSELKLAFEPANLAGHLPVSAPMSASDAPPRSQNASRETGAPAEMSSAQAKVSDAHPGKSLAALPEPSLVPDAAALPSALQPAPAAAASPIAATPPAPAAHDFAELIDRLVEARHAVQTTLASQTVNAAVNHAEFGRVSLQFQQDAAGLSVTLAGNDPDLARAVQAAAPTSQPGSGPGDNAAAPRQDSSGQSFQNAGQAQSQLHQQRAPAPQRADAETRHGLHPDPRPGRGAETQPRNGIFA